MAISSSLYMIMYLMMFFAAFCLRNKFPRKAFHIPFGNYGLFFCCLLGLFGCLITLIVTFIPPPNIEIAPPMKYAIMMFIGNIILISPAFLLFLKKKR
jgi:glutamate:GABA antiporter